MDEPSLRARVGSFQGVARQKDFDLGSAAAGLRFHRQSSAVDVGVMGLFDQEDLDDSLMVPYLSLSRRF